MRTLRSIMASSPELKQCTSLSVGVREAIGDKGELEDAGRLQAFVLEALAKNYGALEATWVGDQMERWNAS